MKKLIKIIIVFSIVANLGIPNTLVYATSNIEVGDYIEFGTYESEELVWQVIGFDLNGNAILWSNYVIELLAYDAAESGISGSGLSSSDKYGSNRFSDSNIKEWLNSDSTYVQYSTTRPSEEAIVSFESFDDDSAQGSYDRKAGFLSGFSQLEKEQLVNRDYMTKYVSNNIDNNFTYSIGRLEEAYRNLAIGNSLSDDSRVFLLSMQELIEWPVKNGIELTKSLQGDDHSQYYWLRTPDGKNFKTVMSIDHAGNVFKTDANYAQTGVVPAISINTSLTPMLSGLGTLKNPYKLNLEITKQLLNNTNTSVKASIEGQVQEYIDTIEQSSDISVKESIARSIEGEVVISDNPLDTRVLYLYYMNQLNLDLHRDIYTENHLLSNLGDDKAKIFSDTSGLTSAELNAIDTLTKYGVIEGYTDGTFKPNKLVSRSEVSKIISIAVQLAKQDYNNEFNDVTSDKWFADYVASIRSRGFVKGYTDGSFKPYDTITYDEMSAIVSRVLQENNMFYHVDMTDKGLSAQSVVSGWASDDVNLLLENQLIDEGSRYNGKEQMTRIDIVVLMDKLIQLIYE